MTGQQVTALIEELSEIRRTCLKMEREFAAEVDFAADGYRSSARNLLHYLGFRQHDTRKLQHELWTLGLSSLGRTEPHVLAGADAVLVALHALAIADAPKGGVRQQPVSFETGRALLEQHAAQLLGPEPDHKTRIMATMPSEAGDDYTVIRDLLAAGMDLMRIDCARDDAGVWRRMISNLETAQREVDRPCKVLMDLAGPKLRTGELGGGARLVHGELERMLVAKRWHRPASAWSPPKASAPRRVPRRNCRLAPSYSQARRQVITSNWNRHQRAGGN